jgi:putative transposase
MPDTIHSNEQYDNNRAEHSQEATRVLERGMRKFKSASRAQRLLGDLAAVGNLFKLGRHLVGAHHYRELRVSAFDDWSSAVALHQSDRFLLAEQVNLSEPLASINAPSHPD